MVYKGVEKGIEWVNEKAEGKKNESEQKQTNRRAERGGF